MVPATFSQRPIIPVMSFPGWFHRHKRLKRPWPSSLAKEFLMISLSSSKAFRSLVSSSALSTDLGTCVACVQTQNTHTNAAHKVAWTFFIILYTSWKVAHAAHSKAVHAPSNNVSIVLEAVEHFLSDDKLTVSERKTAVANSHLYALAKFFL